MTHDLEEQLARYIDSIAEPVSLNEAQAPPEPTSAVRDGRRAWKRPVTAAVVCLVIAASALIAVTRDEGPGDRIATGPDTTTSTQRWPALLGQETPAPDTPDGWKVLDVGDMRFAVPSEWATPVSPTCLGLAGDAEGAVLVHWDPDDATECSPAHPLPDSVLTIVPGPASRPAGEETNVGTLSAVRVDDSSDRSYVLDDGTRITITGPRADQVLATFTDSGAHRALQQGSNAAAADWQTVKYQGLEFQVPANWAIDDLPGSFRETERSDGSTAISGKTNPGECGGGMFPAPAAVSLGTSPIHPSCPFNGTLDLEPRDGVWLRPLDEASPDGAPGAEVVRATVSGLDITVVRVGHDDRQRPQPVLDLIIENGTKTLWFTLGVGTDPSLARSILATLTAP